ncbi:DNA repair helicase RAD25 [Nosema bombycis CQ1]|uniref:DNA 3'-5' helicase n=1 Tax=Nosema bombycis (strain CQ1 / CVCC 102059) TaxID=578461 RepID=R0MKA6_NOSB1|nr:DNA repair helicase RAD25 [Nosema bombycis CQ1]|eukprot:EOB14675.1 DNA repair helicase RAD25 [Nosema bombycis CQ1]
MNNILLPKKAAKHQFPQEDIIMKDNFDNCPLWINFDALIILETFKENSKQASDFLIAIAEPVSRPKYIHEYQITAYSLYAAVSVGLSTDDILSTLSHFSKNILPRSVKNFIVECTLSYGKVKLVIQFNKYFIEAANKTTLDNLLQDNQIRQNINVIEHDTNLENNENQEIRSCEVLNVESVKKRCIEIDYPLIEEYDFRNDRNLTDLKIDLKPTTIIRSYQETCLNKMFCNGRARSGIIVLPCGSGKTLVGITAMTTIKKSCLILCTSAVSVEQWRQQTLFFTNTTAENVVRFTSDHKEWFAESSGILVTTYTMLAYNGRRSAEAQKIMDSIQNTEWGLLLLDEVHVVPAMMFRKVISLVTHHCKLGLTATLVREDDKIEDLNFLIGPKLYEADWQDLSAQGHIAKVECSEVWCNMTGEFYREYLTQSSRKRRLLAIMNPTKFQVCEYLIKKHESKGDKIIVFSDSVAALKAYALKLGKPFIYGPTGQTERMRILKQFQTNPLINTIFLSKVGDTSIDLPEATCLIQISSHFGSRRQEAQRLGRILRAKRRNDPDFKVFFYSLVSLDTDEMFYSSKRQQFLVDQGYTFNIITETVRSEDRVYKTKTQQKELLASVLLATEKDLESEDETDKDLISSTDLKNVSGAQDMAYVEYNVKNDYKDRKRRKK